MTSAAAVAKAITPNVGESGNAYQPIEPTMTTGSRQMPKAVPITTEPVMPSPQRLRITLKERRAAAIGPGPSSAMIGTTKRLASDHAAPRIHDATVSTTPPAPIRSSACNRSPTSVVRSAHPAIARHRERARARPSRAVAGSPASLSLATVTKATPKNVEMNVNGYALATTAITNGARESVSTA